MSEVRKVLANHGKSFFSGDDASKYNYAANMYSFGIFAIIGSFPASFYFSRLMTRDRARAGQYLT